MLIKTKKEFSNNASYPELRILIAFLIFTTDSELILAHSLFICRAEFSFADLFL